MKKIGRYEAVPMFPIDKFIEAGFTVIPENKNGIAYYLKRDSEAQAKVENKQQPIGKWIDTTSFNVDNFLRPFKNPYEEVKANEVFFALNSTSKNESERVNFNFERVKFNPFYMPLVVRKHGRVYCSVHKRWEGFLKSDKEKTECGRKPKGFFVDACKWRRFDKDTSSSSDIFVYGYKISVQKDSDELIKIEYICLEKEENDVLNVVTKTRIISLTAPYDIIDELLPKNEREYEVELEVEFEKESAKRGFALPKPIYDFVIRLLVTFTRNKYGIDISYKNFAETQDYMGAILASPFEPAFALSEFQKLIPKAKKIDLSSPNCFNELCQKLSIKPWRNLRKAFNQSYHAFAICAAAMEIGFKDKNIINKMLSSEEAKYFCRDFNNFVDERNILRAFEFGEVGVIYYIMLHFAKKSEKSVWNLFLHNIHSYRNWSDIKDAARIFWDLFDTGLLSKENYDFIEKEGLSRYVHDMLSNLSKRSRTDLLLEKYHMTRESPFEYTEEEKSLEDDISEKSGDYVFRLAETPKKLFLLGDTLHNCVGTYLKSVLSKECTIVYAMRGEKYRLCIEVRKDFINQARADRNSEPIGDDFLAFNEWKTKHNLVFDGQHW